MTPAAPSYAKKKYYDRENDVLKDGASEAEKIEYEDLHNGYDWMLFYKELEPDMEIPYKLWNGEIVDIAPFRGDGGPGSGNHGHKGVPGQVGGSAPGNSSRQSVTAKNVVHSYTGAKDTKSVVEAQGFGGLPKIYGRKAFDEAVKKSKFIAQRTYSASSKEVLDSYRNMLYNGDFYVDCSIGGAQYGQGMYTAANYEGEINDGMREEMQHYKSLYREKTSHTEALATATKKMEESTKAKLKQQLLPQFHDFVDGYDFEQGKWKPEIRDRAKALKDENESRYNALLGQIRKAEEQFDNERHSAKFLSTEEIGAKYHFQTNEELPSFTETLTLTPDAKIITYDEIRDIQYGSGNEASEAYKRDFMLPRLEEKVKELGIDDTEIGYLKAKLGLFADYDEQENAVVEWKKLPPEVRNGVVGKYKDSVLIPIREAYNDHINEIRDLDTGALAAMLGYDAINADGHGASGSYTVVLNRTKTIFLDETMKEDSKDSESNSTIFFQQGEDGVWYAIRGKEVIGWVKAFDAQQENRTDGGSGSGNFGHKGRPGEVGGSSADSTFDSSKCEVSFGFGDELPKKDVDRALSLCGANVIEPSKNDDVRVRKGPDGVTRVQIETPDAYSKVFLREDRKELYLDELFLKDKGTGKGTAIVTEMVRQAEKNGFETIKLIGGGTKGDSMNGYYSFARLGFDAELPDTTVKKAKDSGIAASRISDLMKTKEGRDFWKENGYAIEMTFRVHEGSESRKALESYTKSRSDGGPGSGNHNHKGVPGQVGGSAPSKSSDQLKSEYASSTSEATRNEIKSLLDRHTAGNSTQRNADYEIAHHIARKDPIGKAMLQKAEYEKAAWKEQVSEAKKAAEEQYKYEVESAERAMAPGGYLENYSREQLEDMNLWPQKKEFAEPKFYRKGDVGGATMAFSTNPDGANMSPITSGEEGAIGYDACYTLSDLEKMGYVPIAGIKGYDVGMQGEAEVLFASTNPTKDQLGKLSHENRSINDLHENEKIIAARGEENAIKEKYDKEANQLRDWSFSEMSKLSSKPDVRAEDYQKIALEAKAKLGEIDKKKNEELTALGKKYNVTLGSNTVPFDIEKDPRFSAGGGPDESGNASPKSFDSSKTQVSIKGDLELEKDRVDKLLALCGANEIKPAQKDRVDISRSFYGGTNARLVTDGTEVWTELSNDGKSMELWGMYIKDRGHGEGTKVFSSIVDAAQANGIHTIKCVSEGNSKTDNLNGYYTWPRLGFDAEFSPDEKKAIRNAGFEAEKVSELISTKEGRAWWKKNGFGMNLSFDTSPDSDSVKRLKQYIHGRQDGGPGSGNHGHKGVPGQVGGSAPSETSSSKRTDPDTPEREAARKKCKEFAKQMHTIGSRPISRDSVIDCLVWDTDWGDLDEDGYRAELDKVVPKSSGYVENLAKSNNGKVYFNVEDLLNKGDDFAKFLAVSELHGDLTALECAKNGGKYDDLITKTVDRSIRDNTDRIEQMYDKLPDSTTAYKDSLDHIAKTDKATHDQFGGSETPALDYFKMVERQHENMSLEDFQLEQAYVGGGLGFTAESLNYKLNSGNASDMTEAEKRFVDMVSRNATELEHDAVLYRGTNANSLLRRFGFSGDIADIEGSDIVGKEVKYDCLLSTASGSVAKDWTGCNVILRFHAAAGTKIFTPKNYAEGECIFPAGLTCRVTSVKYSQDDFPVWFSTDTKNGVYSTTANSSLPYPVKKNHVFLDLEVGSQ